MNVCVRLDLVCFVYCLFLHACIEWENKNRFSLSLSLVCLWIHVRRASLLSLCVKALTIHIVFFSNAHFTFQLNNGEKEIWFYFFLAFFPSPQKHFLCLLFIVIYYFK